MCTRKDLCEHFTSVICTLAGGKCFPLSTSKSSLTFKITSNQTSADNNDGSNYACGVEFNKIIRHGSKLGLFYLHNR